jgi:lipoate-protein ligase A
MIVERAPAAELIPRPLELLDAAIVEGRPLGTWSRPSAPALVLGSGQRPPAGWRPPDGLPLVRRGTGGGAVLCDEDYLMLDIALPPGDPRVLDDVTESYRWLAERLVSALDELGVREISLVQPAALRGLDEQAREAGRSACFAGLGPYELLDGHGRKLLGLAQRRRRGGVLLQAAAYLAGERESLAGLLWLAAPERDDLRRRLRETAVLGPIGLRLPEVLGPVWDRPEAGTRVSIAKGQG